MNQSLKQYRSAIRAAWLPVVGRGHLKSAEYDFVVELFNSQTPIETVLRAVQNCAERAQSTGAVLYSLGVIRADIKALKQQAAKTQVGAHIEGDGWREKWADDIGDLIIEIEDDKKATALAALRLALPDLTKEQAIERFKRISDGKS